MRKKQITSMMKLRVVLCGCALAGILAGCSSGYPAPTNGSNAESETSADANTKLELIEYELLETPDSPIRTIQVNGLDMEIDLDMPNLTWFDANQMTTLAANTIVMRELPDYDIWLDGESATSTVLSYVDVEKIAPNKGIELKLVHKETGNEKIYYIRTIHTDYDANFNKVSDDLEDGYYYFTQGPSLYKMDTDGNIVFFKVGHDRVADFKPYVFDDEVYYSYLENGENFTDEKLSSVAVTQCRAIIMDSHFEVIDTIEFLDSSQGIPENHSIESHDFMMLGLNHYLLCGYVGIGVDNIPTDIDSDGSSYVAAAIVQEIKDGELLLQWNSTEHDELYAYSSECNDFSATDPQDYAHMNSVEVDPEDNNLIISFRHLDALLKIDRTTGDIIWILGGLGDQFGLTEDQLFSHQHHAKFSEDGILTFYDNGNAYEQTRAIQVILDEENMKLVDYVAYQVDDKYTSYMGSTECLDNEAGIFLMGWGGRTEDGAVFTEINFKTGETLFELYDMNAGYEDSSYRAYKYTY